MKASLNDFFAQGKIGERQTTVWSFQGGDTLITSSTHFPSPSFTRLSDKSPPLPNASHEGTRNVSYRSSSLCCRTAVHDALRGSFDGWCAYQYLYGSNSGLMMRFGKDEVHGHNLGTADVCSQLRKELYLSRRSVSLPSVNSPLLRDLEGKVSSSTSWTCLGQLLRQCSTTPLSLRRKSTRYSSTKTSKDSCQSFFIFLILMLRTWASTIDRARPGFALCWGPGFEARVVTKVKDPGTWPCDTGTWPRDTGIPGPWIWEWIILTCLARHTGALPGF